MSTIVECFELLPTPQTIPPGDACQLPSVEAGAALADLIPHDQEPSLSAPMCTALSTLLPRAPAPAPIPVPQPMTDHVARLTESHRSGPGIMTVAKLVNNFTDADEARLFEELTVQAATCAWRTLCCHPAGMGRAAEPLGRT